MPASLQCRLAAEDLDHVLTHTRDLWEGLRGQRLFITGGTGFVGTWLLESFLWANAHLNLGAHAVVLTRQPDKLAGTRPHLLGLADLSFCQGSIHDFSLPPGPFSHVIHAATDAYNPPAGADLVALFDRDIAGTRRLLDFAVSCGARRFLLTSSGAVYGRQPTDVSHLSEEMPFAPDTTNTDAGYGHGKRISEWLCASYARSCGLETTIARLFAFVGPYLPLDATYAVGNFVGNGLRGGPIRVGGDGTPCRSYLYAADLAIWLWTILIRGKPARPYNVGSDQVVTIAELAANVAACFVPKPEVVIVREPKPGAPAERYVPAVARARSELNLEVWVSLPVALHKTIAFAQTSNPK